MVILSSLEVGSGREARGWLYSGTGFSKCSFDELDLRF
jgi:hypothetical protein